MCLKEVDILGEIERVLATVPHHVCIEDVIGALEHPGQMSLVDRRLEGTLQQAYHQINHLENIMTTSDKYNY